MSSLIENIPIAKIPDDDSNLISVYLTSIPSVDCVTFAFTCYRQDFEKFQQKMSEALQHDVDKRQYVKNFSFERFLNSHLFIFERYGKFFRVQIIKYWNNGLYYVRHLDGAFTRVAFHKELFLSPHIDFVLFPAQGFSFPLKIAECCMKRQNLATANYAFERVAVALGQFCIKMQDGGTVLLYCKTADNKYVNISMFIEELIGKNFGNQERKIDNFIDEFIAKYRPLIMTPKAQSAIAPVVNTFKTEIRLFEAQKTMLLKCSNIIHPNSFYLKKPKDDDWYKFEVEMFNFYQEAAPHKKIAVGGNYAARHKFNIVRVKVISVDDMHKAKCILLDKGKVEAIMKTEIFDLDEKFKQFGPYAVSATIANIKPKNRAIWSLDATRLFMDVTEQKLMDVKVFGFNKEKQLVCDIDIEDGRKLSDLLIAGNLAERVDNMAMVTTPLE